MEALRSISTLSALGTGLDHPEGVAWGPDGKVYAGGEAGQVYRVDLATNAVETFANTGGFVLGLAHDAAGNTYICDTGRVAVMKVTPRGDVGVYSAGTAERPMRVPNYLVFDADGNLYVSDSGTWGAGDGFIWRVKPDGAAQVWDTQATGFTNGMCLGPDGRSLYVVESTPPRIVRIPIQADGSPGTREVVVELPRTVPDGVAFDAGGTLYISLYNPNIIYSVMSGHLHTLYDDWEQLMLVAPTNIAFGGPDLKTLLIANLCGWNLCSASMDVPGLPVKYPSLA
ncbi:MAG: SMP-30/gluconolactonase/LRE family protein [Anaerolineae bacterium]